MCLNAHYHKVHDAPIWIPEIESTKKVSSHAQIWPEGAEKQLKVKLGWWVEVVV